VIRRTMDAGFLNSVINHPDVRPMVGGEGEIDLQGLADNPANVLLETEHGGFFLVRLDGGLYEAHSQFLPEGRGGHAVKAAKAGFRYMFAATDCVEIVSKVPADNAPADGFARVTGLTEKFNSRGVSYRGLTLNRWVSLDAECLSEGRAFHDALEAAKRDCGSELAIHEDDDAHDRAVGATALMVKAGNADKGVWSYNRWAAFAGYQTASLLSQNPVIIDVRDAVVTLADGRMEVLKCR
jgi:hypothetical protein